MADDFAELPFGKPAIPTQPSIRSDGLAASISHRNERGGYGAMS
jgi:hypothetical protein